MKKKLIFFILSILIIIGIAAGVHDYFHWQVTFDTEIFTESAEEIWNPDRGFYHIYGFLISDEPADMCEQLDRQMEKDTGHALAMVQINLREYRDKEISEEGLNNIESLFRAMSATNEHWIVRFLYDWDGENEKNEPQSMELVLSHMQQVGEILTRYRESVFTLQGLFVGNWGEINGTKYADKTSLQKLAKQLVKATDGQMYLAVRTPAHWRQIMDGAEDSMPEDQEKMMYDRLGLFNDGMLGSGNDCGTYGEKSAVEAGEDQAWNRKEELEFQEKLCSHVPNGGEVIIDNEYNDLEHAIADLKTMHVTYLNQDYDEAVLEKWASSTVQTSDCFDGMDGLSYIQRHLGYRPVLSEVFMQHNFWEDTADIKVSLQNVGFAPVYKECEPVLLVKDETGQTIYEATPFGDITSLAGGNETEKKELFSDRVPLRGLKAGCYSVYFAVRDTATGSFITFANEQKIENEGYKIGTILLES